jgi:hypothetical protein
MSRASRIPAARRLGALGGPLLILVVALGGATAACSGDHGAAPATATGSEMPVDHGATPSGPVIPLAGMTMPSPEEIQSTWAARPQYVHTHPDTSAAYAYALARPDVVQWLPCYCGCGAMGHGSNLDCYYKPRAAGTPIVFEEHASYCDVCVKTTLMAEQMLRDGKTLLQVRAAVDSAFGGLAPGTPTELPPAS